MNPTEKMKYIKRRVIRTFILMVVAFFVAFLMFREKNVYTVGELSFASMSTWVQYKFWVRDKASYPLAARLVQQEFRFVERMCNIYDENSELSQLNRTAAEKPFHCSDELWDILITAKKYHEWSDGAFDVTILPLKKLWKECRELKRLPSEKELQAALNLTGLDKVVFDEKAKTVFFTKKGMGIDLGGIAKGAALDNVREAAEKACFVGDHTAREVSAFKRFDAWLRGKTTYLDCGYINVGGNVCVLEKPEPQQECYRFGVKNPFSSSEQKVCAYAKMDNECVATSGSYERFVEINGKRYSHIINPKTGMPVERSISATVITKGGIDSDAASTAVFVGGWETAEKLKDHLPDLRVLLYQYKDGEKQEINTLTIGVWEMQGPLK